MALPKKIQDQRKELVDQVVKDIENGKPFFWDSGHCGKQPRNLLKAMKGEDKFYRGINAVQLTVSSMKNGFTDSRWATFKQAQEAGGRIKKGAKGTHIEYWQYTKDVMAVNPKTGKKEPVYEIDPDTGEKRKKQVLLEHPIVKSYVVFNGDQIEGIEKEVQPTIKHEDQNKYMENMLKNSEAKIFYDQANRNFYSPAKDEIHVMPREKFKTMDAFYATAGHEIAHSTGAPKRLDRETLKNNDGFGKENYAREELRAEFTSMFLQQRYNVKFDEKHYENHAAYLQNWAQVIKNDPNEIYRAAADAEKAMGYIETRMIKKNLTKEKSVQKETVLENKPVQKRVIKQKITMKFDTQKSKSKERTLTR